MYLGTYYEIWDYCENPTKIAREVANMTDLDLNALYEEVNRRRAEGLFQDRFDERHFVKKVLNEHLMAKDVKVRVV